MFENSWSLQHNLTVEGGNDKGRFLVGLGIVDNDGIVKGKKDTYNRFTGQLNAEYKFFKWLSVQSNTSIEKYKTKRLGNGYGSFLNAVVSIDPLTPPYIYDEADFGDGMAEAWATSQPYPVLLPPEYTEENPVWYGTSKYIVEATGNPLARRDVADSYSEGVNVRGSLAANLTPFDFLTITSRLGYRIAQGNGHSYGFPWYLSSMATSGNYSISANTNASLYYQWENFANFNKQFGKHNVGAMVGMSFTKNHWDNTSVSSSDTQQILRGDAAPNFRYIDCLNDNGKAHLTVGNTPGDATEMAYFGRLSYSYDDRYFLQFNFRADAFDSSKLSADKRWGYFPSVSAGWTISNEKFFKDNVPTNIVSFLKLRASWGRNGNISVLSNYPYTAAIAKGSSWYQYGVDQIGSVYGSAPDKLANPDLTWETSEQVDLGLDARFLNNRLTFGVDYFDKRTKDLLFSVTIPSELGFTSVVTNGGNVLNRGLEFELGWRDRISDFSYSINANFSTLHNEVLSLAEGATPSYKTDASSTNYQIRTAFEEGHSIWYLNGYIYEGMDAEGNPKFKDINGDGEIGTDDMTDIGRTTPSFTYGINITAAWKGFDFMLNGYGQGGNKILPVLHRTGYKNSLQYYLDEGRTPENPGGSIPHPEKIVSPDVPFWSSTGNLFSGNYFRIKQLQLGYTIPANITKKVAISNLRLYVSLDDFFTITSYPGLDPETASTNNFSGAGLDWGSYPTMKKLILGVNVTF